MVGGIDARVAAREINEVEDAGATAGRAPELRFAGEQVVVEGATFFGRRVRAEQFRIELLGQQRGRAVAVEPQPAVFVDEDGMLGLALPQVGQVIRRFEVASCGT